MIRTRLNNPVINLRDLFTKQSEDMPDWVYWEECIYEIKNLLNGKKYIGQAKLFYQRLAEEEHFSHFNAYVDHCMNGGNTYLYNAIQKYGSRNFEVTIIDELDSNELTLSDLEIYWISYYHTCVYDPLCNGYNMTHGGDCGDQLHTEKANLNRLASLLNSNRQRFGDDATIVSHLFTEESLRKRYETNLINGDGDPYYMIHTDEIIKGSQLRMRRTNEFNNIHNKLDSIRSKNLDVTPYNYYKELGSYVEADRHIEVICNELYETPSISDDPRWTTEIDSIFKYFDSFNDWEPLHKAMNAVTRHGGIVKLRNKFFNSIESVLSNGLSVNWESLCKFMYESSLDRVKSYLSDPLYITNDYRWRDDYYNIFKNRI